MLINFDAEICHMGIKERKGRHKSDLKQKILDAAKTLFMKHGYEATTIRKIAAEIEFSPTTIYLYYKDKSDIVYALHREGFRLLAERFVSLAEVEHPFERLKAMGRAYIRFAMEKSDFYELMFVMKEPLSFLEAHCDDVEGVWEEGFQVFEFLRLTIEQCKNAGYFQQVDTLDFSLLVWSTVHGLCTLSIHGHLDHMMKNKELMTDGNEAVNRAYESLVRLLEGMK